VIVVFVFSVDHFLNSTMTQVMLSVPIPEDERMSAAQIWSNNSSTQFDNGSPLPFFSLTLLRICSAPS